MFLLFSNGFHVNDSIFSRILGELPDTKITNEEKIESGSRFQFIAITDSWKNQRRKRRQQAREHQSADYKEKLETEPKDESKKQETEGSNELQETSETDSQAAKRIKLDENTSVESSSVENSSVESAPVDRVMQVINSSDSPPLLHIEVSVQSKTLSELQAIVEVKLTYLNGTSSLNGVYELLQFIQNKWSQPPR